MVSQTGPSLPLNLALATQVRDSPNGEIPFTDG